MLRSNRLTPDMVDVSEFWELVNRQSDDQCWEWRGSRDVRGYGKLHRRLAHRIAYAIAHGEAPQELLVCHRCDNPPCCNPKHLFPGTDADNMRDMAEKGRWNNKRFPGESNSQVRLTVIKVRDIRYRYAQGGVSIAQLAKEFQVCNTTIYNIVHRLSWREAI